MPFPQQSRSMCVLSSLVELKNISIKDYVCTQHTLIKLQDILTVEVFKSKHIHLRTLAQFPLYSCKMLMMLSKYKSLSPSQKNGSSYIKFNLQCYFTGLLSVNYPGTTKQGHKSGNSLHHTLGLLKKKNNPTLISKLFFGPTFIHLPVSYL